MALARSRSPPPGRGGGATTAGPSAVPVSEDVAAAHRVREAYAAPAQSKFRVAAVIRFRKADGSEDTIEAVNAEPHDANIRGAICAERAGLCRFQLEQGGKGSQIVRITCTTDHKKVIFPGPCCREFITSCCAPEIEVVAGGTEDTKAFVTQPLAALLPAPSVYRRKDQVAAIALAEVLARKVGPPVDEALADTYAVAVARAKRQTAQLEIFPLVFAAAVRFEDGRVYAVQELKANEYGCTVDAVSLLMPEMLHAREEGTPAATCIVQADNYGVAHAPFAAARGLLVEHGFGSVRLCAHDDEGEWVAPFVAQKSLPHTLDIF